MAFQTINKNNSLSSESDYKEEYRKNIVIIRVHTNELVEASIKAALKCGEYDLRVIVEDSNLISENIESRLKSLENIFKEEQSKRDYERDKEEQSKKDYENNRVEYEEYCNILESETVETERARINALVKEENKYQYEKAEYEREQNMKLCPLVGRDAYVRIEQNRNMKERNILDYERKERIRIEQSIYISSQNEKNYYWKEKAIFKWSKSVHDIELKSKINLDEKEYYKWDKKRIEEDIRLIETYTEKKDDIKLINKKIGKRLEDLEKIKIEENMTNYEKDCQNILGMFGYDKLLYTEDYDKNNHNRLEMLEKTKEYNTSEYNKMKKFREMSYMNDKTFGLEYMEIFYGTYKCLDEKALEEYTKRHVEVMNSCRLDEKGIIEDKIEYERMEQNIVKHNENMEKLNNEEYDRNKAFTKWSGEKKKSYIKKTLNQLEKRNELVLENSMKEWLQSRVDF